MRLNFSGPIFLFLLLVPFELAAQFPLPIGIEARVGLATPTGDFADNAGVFGPESGPSFAIGGSLDPVPGLSVFAAYQQTRFGCEVCEMVEGFDETTVLAGLETGLRLSIPLPMTSLTPWLRGALLYQTLEFSGFGERLTSEGGVGFGAGAGLAIPITAGLELAPGITYFDVPAEFRFQLLPDRSVDVTAFTFDLGVAYRF